MGDNYDFIEDTERTAHLPTSNNLSSSGDGGQCLFSISLYADLNFRSDPNWSGLLTPLFSTIASMFLLMVVMFGIYDHRVQLRNSKVLKAAEQSNALISSFFPGNVRKRLMEQTEEAGIDKEGIQASASVDDDQTDAQYDEDDDELVMYKSKPIADLFPESTILFADISGTGHDENGCNTD